MTKDEKHMTKIDLAIQKLTMIVEQNAKRISALEERVKAMEDKPAKNYEARKQAIAASICSGVGALIFAILLGLILYFGVK